MFLDFYSGKENLIKLSSDQIFEALKAKNDGSLYLMEMTIDALLTLNDEKKARELSTKILKNYCNYEQDLSDSLGFLLAIATARNNMPLKSKTKFIKFFTDNIDHTNIKDHIQKSWNLYHRRIKLWDRFRM